MTERSENGFPKARAADLVTERIGDELVVYDGLTSEAHCLGALASAVFIAADGMTSPAQIAANASDQLGEPVTEAQVEAALGELRDRRLVTGDAGSGISRRTLIHRGAAVGGAAVAASLVTSVVTPAYGATASGTFPGSLSGIWILVKCGSGAGCTYYRMGWEQGYVEGAPTTGVVGPTFSCGNCVDLPAPAGTSTTYPTGTNAKIDYDSGGTPVGVTISLPAGYESCTLEGFVVKCGGLRDYGCPYYLPNYNPATNVQGWTYASGVLYLPIANWC